MNNMTEYQKHQQKVEALMQQLYQQMPKEEADRRLAEEKAKRIEMVKLLVEHGANPNIQDNNGNTALHHAALSFGYVESAKIMADAGADVLTKNKDGKTAIQLAYERGYDELGDLLLKYVDKKGGSQ